MPGGIAEGQPGKVDDELLARMESETGQQCTHLRCAVMVQCPASSMTGPAGVVRA
ncbi:hypothetical protein [Streptomyces sp. NBC_01142]|uniref:hypothetical protein n=1 Tax=Streptomyces sp. NBC_01142 TaxID=2975865 RepID=UPI002B1E4130|nr:hypothetical protein [Streptomyces sp. NBC_01142]